LPEFFIREQAMIPLNVREFCDSQTLDLTPIRSVLLNYVWEHPAPVKAYDMVEVLREKGVGSPKPPTVYRTLDFLETQGLVHKIHALNAYVPCHHPGTHKNCQFLICDSCGNAEEFCDAALSSLIPVRAKNLGFQPRASVVEVFGVCRACVPN